MSCKSERERDFEELMSSLETELFENFENAFALFALAGVLLGQANVISSRSLIRPALFDLELEWTVGDWGGREDILISVVFPQAAVRNDTFTKCLSTHDPFSLSYLYSVSFFVFVFCFCLSLGQFRNMLQRCSLAMLRTVQSTRLPIGKWDLG